ncbi:MAG: threonine--tRNA ligase [Candidatus Aenigmatarchaeota archaeon]
MKEEIISKSLEEEKKIKSEWFILTPDGEVHEINKFDFSKFKNLKKFATYEMEKSRKVEKEPIHINLMKHLELVGYEPGSDPGNFRFLPKGRLIKSLLEELVTQEMLDYGAMEVETPIMYDFNHPALKKYVDRFPARQYIIDTPSKRLFLRFSACFGQFLMAHDTTISYRNLPMRLYELTKYSFRFETRGELVGLRRLRAFTMPDCHAFCSDLEQAKKEMLKRFDVSLKIQEKIGFNLQEDLELAVRATQMFWKENKKFLAELVKKWRKPALLEIWEKQYAYFSTKYELNFVDTLNKASALTTDQIDVENGKIYDIKFRDKDNKLKNPLILHLSPSGAIERVIYALLERASTEKNPLLPIWLSPTQVRLCPVNDSFIKNSEEIADIIEKNDIRVDIDDRAESIEKKVRDAEMEWVPYIVVIGEKEIKSGKLAVRFRKTGEVKSISKEELIDIIRKQIKGLPFKKLPLSRYLTERPTF